MAQHLRSDTVTSKIAAALLVATGTIELANNEARAGELPQKPLVGATFPVNTAFRNEVQAKSDTPNSGVTEHQDGVKGNTFDRKSNSSRVESSEVPESIREKVLEIIRSIREMQALAPSEEGTTLTPEELHELSTLNEEELIGRALEVIQLRVDRANELELLRDLYVERENLRKIQEEVRQKQIEDFPFSALIGAASFGILIGLGLYQSAKEMYQSARAYFNRGKVTKLWEQFESRVAIEMPSSGSTAFSYPRAVAEIKGDGLLKINGFEQRIPPKMLETFSKYGLTPKVVVWADGMQSTSDGVEFSGVSARSAGVEITSLEAFRYLGNSLWKGFVERNQENKSFVEAALKDAQGIIVSVESLAGSRFEWRSSAKYLAKLSSYLKLDDYAQFFKDIRSAASMPKDVFEQLVDAERKVLNVVNFPFTVERKLEGTLAAFEHLVERLEKKNLSPRKTATLRQHLQHFGERLEAAIEKLIDVESRYSSHPTTTGNDFFASIDEGALDGSSTVQGDFSIYTRASAVVASLKKRVGDV